LLSFSVSCGDEGIGYAWHCFLTTESFPIELAPNKALPISPPEGRT
jgi:hypothetical protein